MDKYREKSSGEIVKAYQVNQNQPIPEWAGATIVFTLDDYGDGKVDIRTPYGTAGIFPGDWLVYRPSDKSYGGYSDGGFKFFFEKIKEKPVNGNPVSVQIRNFLDKEGFRSNREYHDLLSVSADEIDRLAKSLSDSSQEKTDPSKNQRKCKDCIGCEVEPEDGHGCTDHFVPRDKGPTKTGTVYANLTRAGRMDKALHKRALMRFWNMLPDTFDSFIHLSAKEVDNLMDDERNREKAKEHLEALSANHVVMLKGEKLV